MAAAVEHGWCGSKSLDGAIRKRKKQSPWSCESNTKPQPQRPLAGATDSITVRVAVEKILPTGWRRRAPELQYYNSAAILVDGPCAAASSSQRGACPAEES